MQQPHVQPDSIDIYIDVYMVKRKHFITTIPEEPCTNISYTHSYSALLD